MFGYENKEESELILLFQKDGNEDAFQVLLERYRPLMKYMSMRYILPTMDFDDYRQESCLVMYSALQSYAFDRNVRFSTYYRRLLDNHFCQMTRFYGAYKRRGEQSIVDDNIYEDYVFENNAGIAYERWLNPAEVVEIRESLDAAYNVLSKEEKRIFCQLQLNPDYQVPKKDKRKAYRCATKFKKVIKSK